MARFGVVLLAAAVISFAGDAFAKSSVWCVEKNGSKVYIAGTCHCLNRTDYPLPPEFEYAYTNSVSVYFECSMDDASNPATGARIAEACKYKDGTDLKAHISGALYEDLNAYCATNGCALSVFVQEKFKPTYPMLMLTITDLMKHGISPEWGADLHFFKRAKRDGKPRGELETVEVQIDVISTMSDGMEEEFVRYSLDDLRSGAGKFKSIVAAWRVGDRKELESLLQDELAGKFVPLYDRLLTKRNKAWLPKVEALFETKDTELVLVGTAHLVGKGNLLQLLEARGAKVTSLVID